MAHSPLPQEKDKLLTELQALIQDAEKLLHHSADMAGDQVGELREQIRSRLDRARDNLYATESTLRGCCKEQIQATEHYVQEHPLQSLGLCAGIGFLLGLLVARR